MHELCGGDLDSVGIGRLVLHDLRCRFCRGCVLCGMLLVCIWHLRLERHERLFLFQLRGRSLIHCRRHLMHQLRG